MVVLHRYPDFKAVPMAFSKAGHSWIERPWAPAGAPGFEENELPELSLHQLDCLERFLRFEMPIEDLHSVLEPLITFTLDGPNTHQTVHYAAGIPSNPIKVTLTDVNSAIERFRTSQLTPSQLQQWATMVLLNDAFEWSGNDEERISDILNDLSATEERSR